MPRIRSVHPNICTSETMAALPAEVERTYVRLWTHCDDHGRCVDNVKLIKAALFPLHDDVTYEVLDAHLDALVAGKHLIGYEVDGKAFLQVREWTKYQHPQRPRASTIPVRDAYAKGTRGSMEMESTYQGLEGRGDCADKSATVPAHLAIAPNPEALAQARAVLGGPR